MSVSVIIPFYNAQKYIHKAIDSCLKQNEVSQLILVDDGSTDKSVDIIESFGDERILLLSHNQNKGRSTARNTGMSAVTKSYLSFLDADDFFLENRFSSALMFLDADPLIDGVYEQVKTKFESGIDLEHYPLITAIMEEVEPCNLFEYLVLRKEHFSIIGCTFRSTSVLHNFSFDENLVIGEDTDFIWNLAFHKKLIGTPGPPKIVRRVHNKNTVFSKNKYFWKYIFYKKWNSNLGQYKMKAEMKAKIISSYAYYKSKNKSVSVIIQKIYQWKTQGVEIINNPDAILGFF
ncbi:MAG: glycosyltransferase [Saprospiraceae bacterium]